MSVKILAALAVFVVAFPSALATQHTVGGSQGWKLSVNYTAWAAGETFAVGDTLLFKYTPGNHNVYVVTEANYQACATTGTALNTGADVLTLAAGSQYYICGIPGHCDRGMLLAVTVSGTAATPVGSPPPPPPSSASSPPPPSTASPPPPPASTTTPPPPPSSAPGTAFSQSHAWVVGVVGVLIMIDDHGLMFWAPFLIRT